MAKESLLADPALASTPVTVLGRGRSVIGGTLKGDLLREDVEAILLNGFFPDCSRDAEPNRQRAAGFQELGLPYVADPAVTKHLAAFLKRQADYLARPGESGRRLLPTAILFNGGVFKAPCCATASWPC